MKLELLYGNYYEEDLKNLLKSCNMPTDKIHKGLKIILNQDGENIGGSRAILSNDEKSCQLCSICIRPAYQRSGYGSKMMQMVHQLLEDYGVENFYVASVNTAIKFYENLNYKQVSLHELPIEFVKPMWRIYSEYERTKVQRRIGSFMLKSKI